MEGYKMSDGCVSFNRKPRSAFGEEVVNSVLTGIVWYFLLHCGGNWIGVALGMN